MKAGLKERYDKTLKDELRKQFSYPNVMQVPRVEKVILNIGMGEAIGNAKAMDAAAQDLASRAAPSRTSACASACRSVSK